MRKFFKEIIKFGFSIIIAFYKQPFAKFELLNPGVFMVLIGEMTANQIMLSLCTLQGRTLPS